MTPNFALSLSFEGIALLRKCEDVWAQIQEIPLDGPEFEADILGLRNRAEDLDPQGAQVALIIPNEQIRYIDVSDPGDDVAKQEITARVALDGATPYDVSELVYDFVAHEGRLFVAAVAKETLAEAEGFALQNGFEPVCHLAIAPDGQFHGAVFFGTSAVWPGLRASRPVRALTVVAARDDHLAKPEPEQKPEHKPEPEPAAEPQPDTDPAARTQNTPLAAAPSADEKPAETKPATAPQSAAPSEPAPSGPEPDEASGPDASPTPSADARQSGPENQTARPPSSEPQAMASAAEPERSDAQPDAAATVSFSTIRASRPDGGKATPKSPALGAAKRGPTEPKRRLTPVAPPQAKPPEPRPAPSKAPATPEPVASKPAPESEKPVTKAPTALSRLAALRARAEAPKVATRGSNAKSKPDLKPKKPAKAAKTPAPAPNAQTLAAGPVRKKLPEMPAQTPVSDGQDHLSALRASAAQSKPRPKAEPVNPDSEEDLERDRMTVFGARGQTEIGGKPRFLGLALTVGLLIAMAGVAAWASVFLDDGLVGIFQDKPETLAIASQDNTPDSTPDTHPAGPEPDVVEPAVVAALNEVIPDLIPDAADQPEVTESGPQLLAALDGGSLPESPQASPPALAQPVSPRPLSSEEAAATYAATGIWQRAPSAPLEITTDSTDNIYVASLDPDVPTFDAIALPAPLSIEPDAQMVEPRLPPAAGLVFDMDERGLVRATPEGAIAPDGTRVFAGRPPVTPPLRGAPDTAPASVPEQPSDQPEVAVVDPLQDFRPRLRPTDLVETRERVTLQGLSRQELASFRPLQRPLSVQEQVEDQTSAAATKLAVTSSLAPLARPRNMADIVQGATRVQDTETVQVASIAPRTVTPSAPTARSVARSATVRNAINLNKINLIGVYGSPSNRRALVRMSNGKYKKVKVGDQLDGGRVSAIGEAELRYTKSGRNVTLKMPRS